MRSLLAFAAMPQNELYYLSSLIRGPLRKPSNISSLGTVPVRAKERSFCRVERKGLGTSARRGVAQER